MAERAGAELTHGLSGPGTFRRPARRPGPGRGRDQAISSRQSPASTTHVERYEEPFRPAAFTSSQGKGVKARKRWQEPFRSAAFTSSSIRSRISCWSYRALRSLIARRVRSRTRRRTASSTNRDRSPFLPPVRARKVRTARSVFSGMTRFHRGMGHFSVYMHKSVYTSVLRLSARAVNISACCGASGNPDTTNASVLRHPSGSIREGPDLHINPG